VSTADVVRKYIQVNPLNGFYVKFIHLSIHLSIARKSAGANCCHGVKIDMVNPYRVFNDLKYPSTSPSPWKKQVLAADIWEHVYIGSSITCVSYIYIHLSINHIHQHNI